jgi:hypothetical protein
MDLCFLCLCVWCAFGVRLCGSVGLVRVRGCTWLYTLRAGVMSLCACRDCMPSACAARCTAVAVALLHVPSLYLLCCYACGACATCTALLQLRLRDRSRHARRVLVVVRGLTRGVYWHHGARGLCGLLSLLQGCHPGLDQGCGVWLGPRRQHGPPARHHSHLRGHQDHHLWWAEGCMVAASGVHG